MNSYQTISRLAKIVSPAFSGKRLEKFQMSIKVLKDSLLDEQWCKHGSRKASVGFYQGILRTDPTFRGDVPHDDAFRLTMCFRYGNVYKGTVVPEIEQLQAPVVAAWLELCRAKYEAVRMLDEARPKPVITAVGLSPKVTKTLKECDLDIDLPSIMMPPLEKYYVQAVDEKTGELRVDREGKPVMEPRYRILWSPGVKFGQGRFGHSHGCQACGKSIPSCRFVPIEANCAKNGRIALWLGCDCAKNIFGVKDIGLEKQ